MDRAHETAGRRAGWVNRPHRPAAGIAPRALLIAAMLASPGCAKTFPPASTTTAPGARRSPTTPRPKKTMPPQVRARVDAVWPLVEDAAEEYELPTDLIAGVIWVESRFDPRARSKVGARGLMQLMPATAAALAKDMGRRRANSYDPKFNVHAGTRYLSKLLRRYNGDETLAIAAYHAGAGNVSKWQRQGKDLPDWSRKYVAAVQDARARFVDPPVTPDDAKPVPPPPRKRRADPPPPPPEELPESAMDLDPDEPVVAPEPEPQPEPQPEPAAPTPQPEAESEPDAPDVGRGVLPDLTP